MLLFDFCSSCTGVILRVSYGMECSPGGSMLSSKEESLVLFYFVFTLMVCFWLSVRLGSVVVSAVCLLAF